ncbi:SWIM zinc finger family protein [Chitinibacter sp. GC72]|uniref:SWIM zinc finger family protein n=1 Tax=Chitinibacter sp. GC72 TaxID=1526917 RepID=UPI0012FA5783|nr:SWIM zinc finger family protein [Chitinibacter sp. GC72]
MNTLLTLRPDLLSLSDEALIALSNAGFVKKAHKELQEGKAPALTAGDDGALIAHYADGHVTTLAAGGGLRDARCSCPASGLCRHRVTLVLAYRQLASSSSGEPATHSATAVASPATDSAANASANASADTSTNTSVDASISEERAWSPALFAAELAKLPAAILQRTQKLADAGTVLRLSSWQAGHPHPSAQLPMCSVRFFSRHSLNHARCDCIQSQMCEHIALAVMAFAQAPTEGWTQLNLAVQGAVEQAPLMQSPAALQLGESLQQLALQLWQDGSSQPLSNLAASFTRARQQAEQLGWRWLIDGLAQLQQALHDQLARSSRASATRELRLLCELIARWQAASYLDGQAANDQNGQGHSLRPPADLLGVGIKGEVALEHLRLVGLGAQWSDDEQQEQAQLIFTDPDTQAVLVIEKQWEKTPDSATPLWQRRYLGHSLARLAQSQIVTRSAKRFANGALTIGGTAKQSNVLPLTPAAWLQLAAPLRQPDAASLLAHLQAADPEFVRPRQLLEHLHLLPIKAVPDWGWDGARQVLQAQLQCGDGDQPRVWLQLAHQRSAPHAVDTLATLLSQEMPTMLCGHFSLRDGELQVTPLSLAVDNRVIALHGEPTPAIALPDWQAHSASPLTQQLDELEQLLGRLLRQGLRHQGQSARQQARRVQAQLLELGMPTLAERLDEVLQQLSGAHTGSLVSSLAQLYWLGQLCAR